MEETGVRRQVRTHRLGATQIVITAGEMVETNPIMVAMQLVAMLEVLGREQIQQVPTKLVVCGEVEQAAAGGTGARPRRIREVEVGRVTAMPCCACRPRTAR